MIKSLQSTVVFARGFEVSMELGRIYFYWRHINILNLK